MKPLLIFLLLITSFALQAQTTVSVEIEAGPNSGLNIAQDYVEGMCECAKRNSSKIFKRLDFLTSFEEQILLYEGYYEEDDLIEMYKSNPNRIFEIIRTAWNEKWSKVYCITDSSGIYGYLDRMLLFSYQHEAFQHLYDSDWPIKANINRLVNYDPYETVSKNPVTIRDIVERMLREKQGQIAYRQSLEEDIKSMYQKLISYGGKNAKALSAEEFKIELERARKEGQLPETK
jgi:hypothetical protein